VVGNIFVNGELMIWKPGYIYSGSISGSGRVTFDGNPNDTFTLNNANTYTGVTRITGGVKLILGTNGSIENSLTVNMDYASKLDVSSGNKKINYLQSFEQTNEIILGNRTLTIGTPGLNNGGGCFQGTITETGGGITKTGTDKFEFLPRVNSTTSGTYICSEGTLTLANYAGLDNNGTYYGNFIQQAGATITVYQNVTINGNLTMQGGTTNFKLIPPSGYSGESKLTVTGALTATGTNTINITDIGTLTSYPLIIAAGVSTAPFTVTGVQGNLSVVGSTLTFNKNTSCTYNFTDNQNHSTNITIPTGSNCSFNVPLGAVATVSGKISGTGSFIKTGGGKLILTGANDYTGATTVSDGTLQIGNDSPGTIASTSGVFLAAGATLRFQPGGYYMVFSKVISGEGNVELQTDYWGYLVLEANNKYTGTTTIEPNSKVYICGGLESNIINKGKIVLCNDGYTYSKQISGTGDVYIDYDISYTLDGENTYTGTTHILDNSTLFLGTNGSIENSAYVNLIEYGKLDISAGNKKINEIIGEGEVMLGSKTLTIDVQNIQQWNGGIVTFHGYGGSVIKTGPGEFLLTNNNDAGGTFTCREGLVEFSGRWLGDFVKEADSYLVITGTVHVYGALIMQGGTTSFKLSGNYSQIWAWGPLSTSGTNTISIYSIGTGSSYAIIKAASGVSTTNFIATGSGTLSATDDVLTYIPITCDYSFTNGQNYTGNITLPTGGICNFIVPAGATATVSGVISGTGNFVKTGLGKLILSGDNTYTGKTTVQNGVLQIGDGTSGSLTTDNTNGVDVSTAVLRFEPGANMVFNKVIRSIGEYEYYSEVQYKGDDTKTLTLAAKNTYKGPTKIEMGELSFYYGNGIGNIHTVYPDATLLFIPEYENITYSGIISGEGNVRVGGSGQQGRKVTFTKANTYTGPTEISDAVLVLGTDGSIENSEYVFLSGNFSKFDISAGNKMIKALKSNNQLASVILDNKTLTIGRAGQTDVATRFTGIFTGIGGGVTKTGKGNFTMTNPGNTATGTFTINEGLVDFSGKWAGDFVRQAGTTLTITGNPTISGKLTLQSGTTNFDLSATIPSKISVIGALLASGNNTIHISAMGKAISFPLITAASGIYSSSFNVTGTTYRLDATTTTLTLTSEPDYVCQIGSTKYTSLDDALVAVQNGETIKLLKGIEHISSNTMVITKKITLDLNGKDLILVNFSGLALEIPNANAELNLLGYEKGRLIVKAPDAGMGVSVLNGGKATVSGVGASNSSAVKAVGAGSFCKVITHVEANEIGVEAKQGATVQVGGNVYVTQSGGIGAFADQGGTITIDGTININAGVTYIKVGTTIKTKTDITTPTTKSGYCTYTDGVSTVWVKDDGPVCQIGSTDYFTLAAALTAVQNGETIKLLQDIEHPRTEVIKNITFDLNGKILNFNEYDNYYVPALRVVGNFAGNKGEIKLLDPQNGELNTLRGYPGVQVTNTGKLTVTNVTTDWDPYLYGVWAELECYCKVIRNITTTYCGVYAEGGTVEVGGNVSITNENGIGVHAKWGGNVTIDGKIVVPPGATYIKIENNITKSKADFTIPTTKEGYLTYTDGSSTVWVKDNENCEYNLSNGQNYGINITLPAGDTCYFNVPFGEVATISSVISGTGSLLKTGAGKLILAGVNTYEGATIVSAGTLQIGNGTNGKIENTSEVTVAEGAILRFEPGAEMTFGKVISGAGDVEYKGGSWWSKSLVFTANNTYTGTTSIEDGFLNFLGGSTIGDIANNGILGFTNNGFTYTGVISGQGMMFIDGTFTLNGANTYSGSTYIAEGATLILGPNGSIENSAMVNFSYESKLDISAGNKKIRGIWDVEADGSVEIALGNSTLTIGTADQDDGGGGFWGSTSGETGNIIKTGNATFEFYGNDNCTSPGTFTCAQGRVHFSGGWDGDFVKQEGATLFVYENVTIGGNLTMQGGTTDFDLAGMNPSKLTVNFALLASGTNTVNITGVGSADSYVLIEAASGITDEPFTVTGVNGDLSATDYELIFEPRCEYNFTNGQTYSSNIAVSSNRTCYFNVPAGATATISGRIATASTSHFVKTGGGTLILTGTNLFNSSGKITISEGTLQVGNNGTAGTIAGKIVNNGALVFKRSNPYTFSQVISGTGSVYITGAGAITLSGANTYSGWTEIGFGTLVLSSTGTIANSEYVLMYGGAVLDITAGDKTIKNLSPDGSDEGCTLSLGSSTLTIGTDGQEDGNGWWDGFITGTGGNIKKTGSGSFSLRALLPVTATGTFTCVQGKVILDNYDGILNNWAGNFVKNADCTLGIIGNARIGGTLTMKGGETEFNLFGTTPSKISATGDLIASGTNILNIYATSYAYSYDLITAASGVATTPFAVGSSGVQGTLSATPSTLTFNRVIEYVCEIGSVQYEYLRGALEAVQNNETIKLLKNITEEDFYVYSKTFNLDLNGKILNIYQPGQNEVAAEVNESEITLINNNQGEFNIYGSVDVLSVVNSTITVTNVIALGSANYSSAVYAQTGNVYITGNVISNCGIGVYACEDSYVEIEGNVILNNIVSSIAVGVRASWGQVTVNGTIQVPGHAHYIQLGKNYKEPHEYTTPTTKPGYLTYTDALINSTVWVQGVEPCEYYFNNGYNYSSNITIPDGSTCIFDVPSGTATVSGIISGTGNFKKTGAGKLILTGVNTFSGKTVVAEGTLQIGNGFSGSIAETENVNIHYGAVLRFETRIWVVFEKEISGLGSVEINGDHFVLVADNTYTGTTTVEEGRLVLGWEGNTGSVAGNIVLLNDAHVGFYRSNDCTYSGIISGTGYVAKYNTNSKVILTGVNTYSGLTYVNNGTLQIGNGTSGSIHNTSRVYTEAIGILRFEPETHLPFNKVIQGQGSVQIKMANANDEIYFNADNTFTGNTTLEKGVLNFASNSSMTTGSLVSNIITHTGTTVRFNRALTYDGVISGSGELLIATGNVGEVIFNGVHTYTGKTHIVGTLALGASGSVAHSSIIELNGVLNVAKLDISTGNKTINALGNINPQFPTEVVLGNKTLTIGTFGQNNGSGNYIGIFSGSNGNVIKNGSGTFNLTNTANTATGTFSLNEGTLNFGGHWAGNFVKEATSTLTVTGNPTIGGTLTMKGGTTNFNLSAAVPSKLSVTGSAAATGTNTLNITAIGTASSYDLITAASGISTTPFTVTGTNYTLSATPKVLTLNEPTTVPLKLKIFLQGVTTWGKYYFKGVSKTGTYMPNTLQQTSLLPMKSPYIEAKNDYEEINNPFGLAHEVVDWILVELWETDYLPGGTIFNKAVVESKSLLLQIDGTVVDVNGQLPEFYIREGNYRIVVKHRNHLAVMSSETREFKTGTVVYDFTTNVSKAQNDAMWAPQAQMVVKEGVACLWAGDLNTDGVINSSDLSIYRNNSLNSALQGTYTRADINMDGVINTDDHAFILGRISLFAIFDK